MLISERTCEALHDLENGYFRNSGDTYEIGTIIKFRCMDGYEVSGASQISCTALGWSSSQPTCVGKIIKVRCVGKIILGQNFFRLCFQ